MSRSKGSQRNQPRQQPRKGGGDRTRNQVNNYLKQPGGPQHKGKGLPGGGNRYRNQGNNVRNNIRNDRPNFGNNFNNKGWNRANWRGVNNWLGRPYGGYSYYDDGGYYDNSYSNGSYSDSSSGSSTDTGARDANGSADQGDIAYMDQSEQWMPFGVFAMTKEGETDATPNVYLQLAVNKQGMLSGKYLITTTGTTYPVEGVIDKESQRAVWKMEGSDNAPIAETGLFNLTEDEASVRMNFADGRTQNWLLVRIEEEK